jgi:cell fate regulator YaaT (PSP1 superfamily)
VFDWLADMDLPGTVRFDIVEVRFKGARKEFFRNLHNLDLTTGDPIVVDVPNGHHIGYVSLQGELVRLQMQKKKVANDDNIRVIYRVATQKDLDKFEEVQHREMPTLYRTREIIRDLKLEMKLSDVEFHADNTKATFYYSADDRVDFRELIKLLASEFKIRVEMRQISLRQEAGRLGGIGSCGRELCCSTWLTDFKSVSTTAARYQNLSLNPNKLSGQCGRLKCCLNYELDTYMGALKEIPTLEGPILTDKGAAVLQKTDIFRKIMWFGYNSENTWHSVKVERVIEILELNKAGKKPATLLEDAVFEKDEPPGMNADLEKLDKKFANRSKRKKKKKKKNRGPQNVENKKPKNKP